MLDATSLMQEDRLELLKTFTDGLGDCKKVVDASIVKISKNSLSILNKFLKKMIKTSETIEKDILPSSQYDEQFKMVALEDNEKLREILQQAEELFQKAQSVYNEMDLGKYDGKAVKKLKLPTLIISGTKKIFSKIGLKKPQTKDEKIEKDEKSVDREELARELEAQAFEAKANEALKNDTVVEADKEVKAEVSDTIQQIQASQSTSSREKDEAAQRRLNDLMNSRGVKKSQPLTPNEGKAPKDIDDFFVKLRSSAKSSSRTVENPLESIVKKAKTEEVSEPVEEKIEQPRANALYDTMMANLKKMSETPALPSESLSKQENLEEELRSIQTPRFIYPADEDEHEYELSSVEEEKPSIVENPIRDDKDETDGIIEKQEEKDDSSSIKRKLDEWRMNKGKTNADSFVVEQMKKDPVGNFVKSGGSELLRRASETDKDSDKSEEELKASLRRIKEILEQENDSLPREVRATLEKSAASTQKALEARVKASDLASTTKRITIQAAQTSEELEELRQEYLNELMTFAIQTQARADLETKSAEVRQGVYTQDLTDVNNKIASYEDEMRLLKDKRAALVDAINKEKKSYSDSNNGIRR